MNHRRALVAKVKIAQKQLAFEDDVYRDMLRCRYQVDSSTKLSEAQLVDLVEHMKALGFKATPAKGKPNRAGGGGAMQGKIRALWIANWNLGVVHERGDVALARFAERITGKAALRWLDAAGANRVIEALKAMAVRDADVNWDEHENPRIAVVRAQWRRLAALGAVRIADQAALDVWLSNKVSPHKTCDTMLSNDQLDTAIGALGEWLRQQLAKKEVHADA